LATRVHVGHAGSVADQATVGDNLAPPLNGGKGIPCGQGNQLPADVIEIGVALDHQCANVQPIYRHEGLIKLRLRSSGHNMELQTHGDGCFLHVIHDCRCLRIIWVRQEGDDFGLWRELQE
jgi:hypothetical protein